MNEIYIYSNDSYIKPIIFLLLKKYYYFIVVYQYQRAGIDKKVMLVKNDTDLDLLQNNIMCTTFLQDVPTNLNFCVIAVKVHSFLFKRLWVIEKRMKALVYDSHQLNGCVFIESIHNTSVCINIYSPKGNISASSFNKVAVMLIPSGYGDIFRHAYIFQKFIKEQSQKGKEVTFIHNNPESLKLSKLYAADCENIFFDIKEEKDLSKFRNIRYEKIYSMWDLDYMSVTRVKDVSEFLLGYFYKDMSEFTMDRSYMQIELAERLRCIKKYKKLIGVQFNTAHHNSNYPRNYPFSMAKEFVRICQQENMILVNLTSGYDLNTDFDCSEIDMLAMPAIIEQLDIVVSIDSFSGHLASCFEVPCIILFNQIYSFSLSVLRGNINVVSSEGNMVTIYPHKLYQLMNKVLQNEIDVPREVKENYDMINDSNTIYI